MFTSKNPNGWIHYITNSGFPKGRLCFDWAQEKDEVISGVEVGADAGADAAVDDAGFEVWQGSPPEMPLLGLDVAIARSGFLFNLSPNATDCKLPKAPVGQQCKGSKQEAALFDRVMAGLNGSSSSSNSGGGGGGSSSSATANSRKSSAAATPPTPRSLPQIYGWTEAESDYTIRVSQGGGVVLCSGAPNLSFWALISARMPVDLAQKFG